MDNATWKQRLQARYDELKKLGHSFFPYTIFKDTVAIFFVFIALAVVAVLVGAAIEEIADPTATNYNPRPEWYFLFLFQALKFFPGWMEAIVAIILPSVVVLLLFLLPFLDRGPRRHPADRPLLTTIGIAAVGGFITLTVIGFKSPLLNPVVHQDPTVMAGKQLYAAMHCAYCHSIQGRGGIVGPDLSAVGARRDREWLTRHFKNPREGSPGSRMPALKLLPEEIEQLVAYMETLGGGGPFSPEAPRLFTEHCGSCHALDGVGGDIGPDLTTVRTYREKPYLYDYIADPKKLNRDAAMPGFRETLTDAQIEDLSRYLASTRRGKSP